MTKEETRTASSTPLLGKSRTFTTDYKTRAADAYVPEHLHGSGLYGADLPMGGEDNMRKSLPKGYMPTDLVLLPKDCSYYGQVTYLRREAAESLVRMFRDAERRGLTLKVFSGYRDYQHQARLYYEAVRRNGIRQRSVAKPGNSEHMLGTTADVTSTKDYLMRRSFGNTAEGRWLAANAHRYGWEMTCKAELGCVDEPWHIRYKGCSGSGSLISQAGRLVRKPAEAVGTVGKTITTIPRSVISRTREAMQPNYYGGSESKF